MHSNSLTLTHVLVSGHLNLSPNGRLTAEASRNKLQVELMNLMNDNQYLPEGRFGEMLLLIPTLQRVASSLTARIGEAVTKTDDGLKLDDLLGDILLSGRDFCPPSEEAILIV